MISISHLTALDASPEDFIDAAAAAGFQGVGLRIQAPRHTPDRWPVAGDLARARSLRQRAADAGISVFEAEAFPIWPETEIADYLAGLQAASEMGATHLLVTAMDADEQRFIERCGLLCDHAARLGLTSVLEFMPFRSINTLGAAMRVQDAVGRSNLRLLVDTLHLMRSGGSAEDMANLPLERLGYIHLCDATATAQVDDLATEARTLRLYPGEGELPLLEILSSVPPHIDVSVEAPNARHAHLSASEQIGLAGRYTLALVAAAREAARRALS
ncbi:sugar phosphate isomerase/epimerase family protein [Pelagibacterium lacus]|uniref:Sugar phosphate isomerase/epimerase n=1 Tax=Pelagibacterium lacus TaxID=2282655 RepID=A0A369VZP2_9HYPH|nr:sugar phosphate isomerase/epimerase [Pelagibacterium lacus]RDE07884.1 sugar phosphate isomerase/epimerase [Pelagibacterium lacus]